MRVRIYNQLGQKVIKSSTQRLIDISRLIKGIYFIELSIEGGAHRRKLLIQ
ncbi:MAG: T9SS type A sorting domain-containing protein [Bacteroidales bacterium]|nr:T9SS type A sorting domain-containing protein [Bacteroidales bacterium]